LLEIEVEMTEKEAKRLLIGTVVMWDTNQNDCGTVREVSPSAVFVDWENGQRGWIAFKDMKRISIR
jgi:hypothetical protein